MSATEKGRLGDEPLLKVRIMEDGSAVDVSSVTTKEIKVRSPSGTTTSYTAAFTTDGTDGWIEYQTGTDEIDEAGDWRYSGSVVFSDGRPFESEDQYHNVEAGL